MGAAAFGTSIFRSQFPPFSFPQLDQHVRSRMWNLFRGLCVERPPSTPPPPVRSRLLPKLVTGSPHPPPHCVPPDGGTGKTLCSRLQEIFLRRGDQSAAPCPSCRADFVAVPIATDPVVTAAVVAAMDTPEAREISARKREVDESRGVHTGTYVPPCSGWSL